MTIDVSLLGPRKAAAETYPGQVEGRNRFSSGNLAISSTDTIGPSICPSPFHDHNGGIGLSFSLFNPSGRPFSTINMLIGGNTVSGPSGNRGDFKANVCRMYSLMA
jgi:hypothetical protein